MQRKFGNLLGFRNTRPAWSAGGGGKRDLIRAQPLMWTFSNKATSALLYQQRPSSRVCTLLQPPA